jgi:hypothetical protein
VFELPFIVVPNLQTLRKAKFGLSIYKEEATEKLGKISIDTTA